MRLAFGLLAAASEAAQIAALRIVTAGSALASLAATCKSAQQSNFDSIYLASQRLNKRPPIELARGC